MVPKRRLLNLRRRGNTQKKTYYINFTICSDLYNCILVILDHSLVSVWWYQRLCNTILTLKHVETWNKLTVKLKFCASSWLITEIIILRCTVSKTSKYSGDFLYLSLQTLTLCFWSNNPVYNIKNGVILFFYILLHSWINWTNLMSIYERFLLLNMFRMLLHSSLGWM